jgi:O-acetyl-ADP-ribose deacetylase (regulator of RNase III)
VERGTFDTLMDLAACDLNRGRTNVAEWLLAEAESHSRRVPDAGADARTIIRDLLTIRPADPIPEEIERQLDVILEADTSARGVISADAILASAGSIGSAGGTHLKLWQGDITRLAVDAIVNAANAELLGCFLPGHACIDNAIHSAAGPRLRDDCARLMRAQGHLEPMGNAKITPAYHLPSRFVLHTVGPIVRRGPATAEHANLLARCYEACLSLATEQRTVRSLAFCGISTGVFGYPKGAAAAVAQAAVASWLERNRGHFDLIVFNVFGDSDRAAHEAAWNRSFGGATA